MEFSTDSSFQLSRSLRSFIASNLGKERSFEDLHGGREEERWEEGRRKRREGRRGGRKRREGGRGGREMEETGQGRERGEKGLYVSYQTISN